MRTLGILLVVMAFLPAILFAGPVRASPNYLNVNTSWLRAVHTGCDPYFNPGCLYYGSNVYAYMSSTNATAVLIVSNPYSSNVTVWYISAVKILMDWGTNYTSKQASLASPATLTQNNPRAFTISFIVPDPSVASNFLQHSYEIIIEFVSGPNGNSQGAYTQSGTGFVVYSQDQVDVWNLMGQLGLTSATATSSSLCGPVSTPYGTVGQKTFTSPQANSLCLPASREVNIAMTSYQLGNFVDAKGHLQSALQFWNQAVAVDENSGSSASTGVVVMNVLVGLGVALAGIAAAVFSFKRSFGSAAKTQLVPT